MNNSLTKIYIFVATLFLASIAWANLAMDLLKESDLARGTVKTGLTWKSQISTEQGGEKSQRKFNVKVKGDDAYVEATAPDRNKGEIYLFNNRNMWFFKPSLKKPVSISSKQKLTGQAANGDIASTNYARDYTPTIEKEELLNGEKHYVLMLKAKAPNLTYDSIRYWINAKTKLAVKAEFLDLQGKAFKMGEMQYNNSITYEGKKVPFVSEMKISDVKFKNDFSVIRYSTPKTESHADAIFKVNNLTR